MEIRLSDDQVKAAVAGAVASLMTGEQRAKLIENAIAGLLTERAGNYSSETRIQKLFSEALVEWARKEVDRLVVEDADLTAKLRSLVAEAAERAFAGEAREQIVEKMASGIRKAITGRDY